LEENKFHHMVEKEPYLKFEKTQLCNLHFISPRMPGKILVSTEVMQG
jgi:hypothetical protein